MRPENTISRAGGMTIGGLARQSGVAVETIRYYERIGLLPAPRRSRGRHRLYEPGHVARLEFVRRARQLGYPLAEVRALLRLAEEGRPACAAARAITIRHLAEVRSRLADDRRMAVGSSAAASG